MTGRGWLKLFSLGMAFMFLAGLGVAAVRQSWLTGLVVGLPLFILAALVSMRVRPEFRMAEAWLRNRR